MSNSMNRLDKILECIENIDFIINDNNLKLTHAIEDKIIKPAIRMNIIRIAEQFVKLKDDNEFKVLENFTNEDLKGISSVRNYIAHDYDSTDDNIIEDVIRYNLPIFKTIILNIKKDINK
ncbi:HepT-like ribonuclease domain-containing protein [Arcobacter sp.]|uniref:HepT-like ribonuclease domain-containing protein n=1 Tax=Arcobacter sp. TaxID=1872629 RepID=UPI003D137BB6